MKGRAVARKVECETREYHSFSDDFVESAQQDYRLPDDFMWIDDSRSGRAKSAVLRPIGLAIANVYMKCWLGLKIENRSAITDYQKATNDGFFVYINHTQTFGDVVLPMLVTYPKRAYILISPSNMGIPVVGSLLPYFGALPIPDNLSQTKKLNAAVQTRIEQGQGVVVYPEGHLWPWHKNIRPLPTSAFGYPVSTNRPVFSATTTYQQRRHHKKPRATVYVDGPFYPDANLPHAKRKEKLRDEVQSAMQARARLSTCEYIRYSPAEGAPAMPDSQAAEQQSPHQPQPQGPESGEAR